MKAARWECVKNLLHRALQLAPEQRGHFLDQECSSDTSLRAEVESLLAAGDEVRSSFLEKPPVEVSNADRAESTLVPEAVEAGRFFAERFQLVRKLGEGGMGQVWLAEQIWPVRRQVALKLIKAGMYDEGVVKRFLAERQSLAIMDHPAIAKVFEAGASELGQPYFVMEYVPGLPITTYCDQKKLTIQQRLKLFLEACDGVQHAHQKAVIHRDLKPANILLTEVDGKPVPRIIDFGLAKAAVPSMNGETAYTQAGHLVGTLAYMSPEQGDSSARDIDTRTDVYSLGVVLYVLLTGALPLELKDWQSQPLEGLRRLKEDDPERPSARVSTGKERAAAAAEVRGTEPTELANQLRGDLDCIAMKALEKDRARRYGSPSELGADIQRYLNHETVAARPTSPGYRLQKYARRHRLAVGIAVGLVLLLTAFAVLQELELRRITRERDRANRERDRATRITDFTTSMFKVSDPSEARGNSVTAREILDKASKYIDTGLVKDPEVRAQMMQVMADIYMNLGLYPRAHELAKRAFDARLSLHGADDRTTLESMSELGWILTREGHLPEAEKMEREAHAAERRVLGSDDPITLETMDHLAVTVQDQGNYKEEEDLERQVIEISARRLGPESAQTLHSMNNLGAALWYQARYSEAEQIYRHLLEVEQRVWGQDHPETLKAMGNLALVIESEGRPAEAEKLYREMLATQQRVLGPEHPSTIIFMENLAGILAREGHMAEAEKLDREMLAIQMHTLGPDHRETLTSKLDLADVLFREGHFQEAEKLERETIATQVRVLGPENPDTLASKSDLARTLNKEGHYAEAEKVARENFDLQARTLGLQHSDTMESLRQLGEALAYSHRYSDASSLLREVIEKSSDSEKQGTAWSVWYVSACVAGIAGHSEDAISYLREAVKRGYVDADGLMADDDLKSLRGNAKFQELVALLKTPSKQSAK